MGDLGASGLIWLQVFPLFSVVLGVVSSWCYVPQHSPAVSFTCPVFSVVAGLVFGLVAHLFFDAWVWPGLFVIRVRAHRKVSAGILERMDAVLGFANAF